jgi:hypothetical protein
MFYRSIFTVILTSIVIPFSLSIYSAFGQEKTDSIAVNENRSFLSVSLSLASTSSGPAADLEDAMVVSRFNQASPGFFGGPVAHPFSRTGLGEIGTPWMIALQYSIIPHLLLGVTLSNAPIGMTLGYRDPLLFLFINYSIFTIASTASLRLTDGLHLGVGPSVYIAESHQDNVGKIVDRKSTVKLGILLDIGLSIPARSRFFGVVSFQYRYVGKVDTGPFKATPDNSAAMMPASRVNFNHIFIAAGVGVRL